MKYYHKALFHPARLRAINKKPRRRNHQITHQRAALMVRNAFEI